MIIKMNAQKIRRRMLLCISIGTLFYKHVERHKLAHYSVEVKSVY